jgi:hypothetical protein
LHEDHHHGRRKSTLIISNFTLWGRGKTIKSLGKRQHQKNGFFNWTQLNVKGTEKAKKVVSNGLRQQREMGSWTPHQFLMGPNLVSSSLMVTVVV